MRSEDALPESDYDEIKKAVAAWKEAYRREVKPALTVHRARDFIQLIDERDPETVSVRSFEGVLAELYESVMETPLSPRMVAERNDRAIPSTRWRPCWTSSWGVT